MTCEYSKCQKQFEPVRCSQMYCTKECGDKDRQYNNRYEIAEKRRVYRAKKICTRINVNV